MKRLLDVAVAGAVLVMTSPIMAAAAIAVKVESQGPALYRGPRVGKDGTPFQILKLRSMTSGTPGPGVTAGDDPRITRVGRFLRRTKIDELPQFLNVLRGDMSLVGPRPEDPKYVAHYTPEQRKVLAVRPGITGPATLAYYDEESLLVGGDPESVYLSRVLPEKLVIDLQYVNDASLAGDIRILGRTFLTMFRGVVRPGTA